MQHALKAHPLKGHTLVYFSLPVLLLPEGNLLKANFGVKAANEEEHRTALNSPTGIEQVPSGNGCSVSRFVGRLRP